MTAIRTPQSFLTVLRDDDASVTPVSAGTAPIEDRIAVEMSATLQDWLHKLPARSARSRKDKRRIRRR